MSEIRIKNWRIQFTVDAKLSAISGLLCYDGKIIPRWGCGMCFIADKFGVRYDKPEVVPEYVKNKLEALRKHYQVG